MGQYRNEWPCGCITETSGWEPSKCPFCTTPPAAKVADAIPELPPASLTWLYTHCRAIGMTCKSDSGKWEHNIALFTINLQSEIADLRAALASRSLAPVDMILFCPACGVQHIDAPEWKDDPHDIEHGQMRTWANPPHRSHLCHGCGHIWRPADVPTNGVAAITTTGKADSPAAQPPQASGAPKYQIKQHGWASMWMDASKAEYDACSTEKQVVFVSGAPELQGQASVAPAVMEALSHARAVAMRETAAARIPECGDFGAIAQNIDWAIEELKRAAPPAPVTGGTAEASDARAQRLLRAAQVYTFNYLQDEHEEVELCTCGPKQHAELVELFAAIKAMAGAKS